MGRVRRVYLALLKHADVVCVQGSKSEEKLLALNVQREKITILKNSLDTSRFKPDPKTQKIYDLIYVGRLDSLKRVEVLLHTLHLLLPTHPHISLAIVGIGKETEKLRKLAHILKIEENVHFFGYQKRVEKFLQKSRIFLFPSVNESLPFAVVEALSCGVPVIAARVGDVEDVVKNGENGLLLDEVSPEAFCKAIKTILDKEKLYNNLAKKAQEIANLYSPKKARESWKNVLIRFKNT